MKTKYLLNFKDVLGSVEFTYNQDGLLVEYLLSAELSEHQLLFLLKRLPRTVEDVEVLQSQHPAFSVSKLTENLSFNTFWEAYGQKIHPHRCEPLWNKLKDGEKLAALTAISAYFSHTNKTGAYRVNPENYIKKQYWKTDWKKQ